MVILTTDFRLTDDTMNQYKEWKERALGYQNILEKRKEEVTVNIINSDPSVRRTYGNKKVFF
jgi:hypothetical protein